MDMVASTRQGEESFSIFALFSKFFGCIHLRKASLNNGQHMCIQCRSLKLS